MKTNFMMYVNMIEAPAEYLDNVTIKDDFL